MKNCLFFFTVFCFTKLVGRDDWQIPVQYQVVSVARDSSISKDSCLVYGYATHNKNPLNGVRISTLDHERSSITDSIGYFSFKVALNDTLLYAFKPKHKEIVTRKLPIEGGAKIEIEFYMKEDIQVEIVLKPIIYLYDSLERTLEIELKSNGELTFTYPQYKDRWIVKAHPNGLISYENKIYPYLFWEGKQEISFIKNSMGEKEGFFIKTDTVINFLQHILAELGLSSKEKADFIIFWGPKISQSTYSNIQFLLDKDYATEIAELTINPKPTSMRRIYIIVNGTENKETIFLKPQKFNTFIRTNFSLIEWGGSIITRKCD